MESKPLSQAKADILKIVNLHYSDEDLKELRTLLLDFSRRKMEQHLDKTVAQKGYTKDDYYKMLIGHDRKAD